MRNFALLWLLKVDQISYDKNIGNLFSKYQLLLLDQARSSFDTYN